jgi:hypothetical protein
MHDITPERTSARIETAGLASYFKALTLAASLVLVWVGLCAI